MGMGIGGGNFTAPVSDWVCGGLRGSESSTGQPAVQATHGLGLLGCVPVRCWTPIPSHPPPPPPRSLLISTEFYPPRSLSEPVSGGKLFVAMPVTHGVGCPVKGVGRLGRPQHSSHHLNPIPSQFPQVVFLRLLHSLHVLSLPSIPPH